MKVAQGIHEWQMIMIFSPQLPFLLTEDESVISTVRHEVECIFNMEDTVSKNATNKYVGENIDKKTQILAEMLTSAFFSAISYI